MPWPGKEPKMFDAERKAAKIVPKICRLKKDKSLNEKHLWCSEQKLKNWTKLTSATVWIGDHSQPHNMLQVPTSLIHKVRLGCSRAKKEAYKPMVGRSAGPCACKEQEALWPTLRLQWSRWTESSLSQSKGLLDKWFHHQLNHGALLIWKTPSWW